ncbi:MAG: ABC transporter substrate-binding protein [Treponema sp.]|jgi:peptide/nickel transport system substrate-binding protein|nr:ABC transporter substrate-binding protein [Treponema sp.]
MKKQLKRNVSAAVLAVLFLILAGCKASRQESSRAAKSETGTIDRLVIGTTTDLEAPSRSVYNFDVFSGTLMQMAPVWMDEFGEFHPLLTEYEMVNPGVWRFKVIEGMAWHDGQPLTAEDIKFTIEYGALQSTGKPQTTYSALNIIDEKTIEMVLNVPNVRHLSGLTTLRILPKHIFETVEVMADASEAQHTVGCGPYKFVSFDHAAGTVEFAANENYPRGSPRVKTIVFRIFGSPDTLHMALKNGEIDIIYAYANGIGVAAAADLAAYDTIKLKAVKDTSNTAVFVFNNNRFPGNDINIRKAVAYAIDYDKFRELFGSEYSTPSTEGFLPAGSLGYVDTPQLKRDLEKSKAFLAAFLAAFRAEAGAADTNGDGIVEYQGKALSITLDMRNDLPVYQRYGELLKANLAEAGIDLILKPEDVPTFRTITEQTHTHEAMISKFTAYGMGMQAGMGSAYLDGNNPSLAQGQIMDPAYGAIVSRLKSAVNLEEYTAAAGDCQRYYAETMPAIALFWDSYIQAYKAELDGFVVDGTFGLLNMQTWYSITK